MLIGFYFIFVLAPLSWTLFQMGISFSSESLSPLFFLLLGRATFFTLLQAFLSTSAVAIFGFFTSYFYFLWGCSSQTRKLLLFLSTLLFTISPTLLSLALLFFFSQFFESAPPLGLGLIVLCHFLINALFFSSTLWSRIDRFILADGEELLEYLDTLGMTKKQKALKIIPTIFRIHAQSALPQVFFWSFTSFTPILFLGKSPYNTSPELLLYYSLYNDADASRLFVITLLCALISFLIFKSFRKNIFISEVSRKIPLNGTLKKESSYFSLFSWGLLFLFFSAPLLFSLGQNLSISQITSLPLTEIAYATVGTLCLVFFSSLLTLSWSALALLGTSRARSFLSKFYFLSPVFILLGWIELDIESKIPSFFNVNFAAYFLVSLGLFLGVLPWLTRQIEFQIKSLPQSFEELAFTWGSRTPFYLRKILWPQLYPSVIKLTATISLWSIGEYIFSKSYLFSSTTLPLLIEESTRRYDFHASSAGITTSILLSAILVSFLLTLRTNRNA